MEANNLHYIATQARNKRVEAIYAEELDNIERAAQAGNFNIILDNKNFTDAFVHYLVTHSFDVKYFRYDKDEWFDCNAGTKVIWNLCSKLCIKW